ncbi:MAG: hypothetical protein GY772_19160 [bacterium]|nr:hypothetical protein [bacterium]
MARQWNIDPLFDELVEVYRVVLKNAGVLVLDGIRFFDSILQYRAINGWHFRSCDETQAAFARLVQQCVRIATTCIFPTAWWKITFQWDWPEMRHTQDGHEVARSARQVMDEQHDLEEGQPRPLLGHDCPEHPDPDEGASTSEAERQLSALADHEVDLAVVEEAERQAAQAAGDAALRAQRAAEGEVPSVVSGSVGTASTGSFTLVGESVRSTDSFEMVGGTVGIATAPTGVASGTVGAAGVSWQPHMPPSTPSVGVSPATWPDAETEGRSPTDSVDSTLLAPATSLMGELEMFFPSGDRPPRRRWQSDAPPPPQTLPMQDSGPVGPAVYAAVEAAGPVNVSSDEEAVVQPVALAHEPPMPQPAPEVVAPMAGGDIVGAGSGTVGVAAVPISPDHVGTGSGTVGVAAVSHVSPAGGVLGEQQAGVGRVATTTPREWLSAQVEGSLVVPLVPQVACPRRLWRVRG